MSKRTKDITYRMEDDPGVSFDSRGFEDAFNEVPKMVVRILIPGMLLRDAWKNPEEKSSMRYVPALGGELAKALMWGLTAYAGYMGYQAL